MSQTQTIHQRFVNYITTRHFDQFNRSFQITLKNVKNNPITTTPTLSTSFHAPTPQTINCRSFHTFDPPQRIHFHTRQQQLQQQQRLTPNITKTTLSKSPHSFITTTTTQNKSTSLKRTRSMTQTRSITFKSGSNNAFSNQQQPPLPQQPHQQTPKNVHNHNTEDDLRRFGLKSPQQYNLSQNPNTSHLNAPISSSGRQLPTPGAQTGVNISIKERFLNDPNIPRWRKDLVRVQDFLSDTSLPATLDSDKTLTRIGKKLIRALLMPSRRIWKWSKLLWLKLTTMNSWVLPTIAIVIASLGSMLYFSFRMLDRVNMMISRELFVRSCVIDLAARLDAYGLLPSNQTQSILQTFKIFSPEDENDDHAGTWYNHSHDRSAINGGKDYRPVNNEALRFPGAPKNFKGQEMMKSFLMQAMSLPIESARILEVLYDPKSRIDEISEGVHMVFLEKMADTDPSQANELCPPHIKAIGTKIVEQWFRQTRLQMIEEKKRKLQTELQIEKIDQLTPQGRQEFKDKLEEFNTGITFDLSKREKRKLFWKGILTGVMIETGLVGLENETTFLRLAREYALKGCVLRKIPEKVKISDDELNSFPNEQQQSQQSQKDPNEKQQRSSIEQALITANPAGEFHFSSTEDLTRIRDLLTQQPYSPDHGQSDSRFLHFLFGRDFCAEYNISPDTSPYIHQIAPLVLFDLATWTNPQTLFDLTFEHQPRTLLGSKYTVSPAEYEKIEMFNFMMEEMVKKDRAYGHLHEPYTKTAISKDELIVLPLLQPQDSLRNPEKYGLRRIDTQLTLLNGRIPQCYEDTYGTYAKQIFLFDMIILRNYFEISRLKRSIGELGTTRIRDMKIPASSNYYGNYGSLLEEDLLDVIKHEENLTSAHRLRRTDFKKEYDARLQSDLASFNIDPLAASGNPDEILRKTVQNEFKSRKTGYKSNNNKTDDSAKSDKADPYSVSVDAELFKELNMKEPSLKDLDPIEQERRSRAKRWIDNGSV
jgi:hypothetical protein